MTKDLNRHFTKEDVRMATKHVKRHPASLVIRKMQIHTTAKYQLIHPHWNDCHKKGRQYKVLAGMQNNWSISDGNAKWSSHSGKWSSGCL